MDNKYSRLLNETNEELICRVCKDKEAIGTWDDVADILNALLNVNHCESKYRKQFKRMIRNNQDLDKKNKIQFSHKSKNDAIENYDEKIRELKRQEIKFRDERNAWQKQNYIDARVEKKLDILEKELLEISRVEFPCLPVPIVNGENEMIIMLSDLHIGQHFDNFFGKYDVNIAKERLGLYLEKVKSVAKLHNAKIAHIVSLGDQISGSIHKTIQITNSENVIKQVKLATEIIASFCYECSAIFEEVNFYSVAGNHTRLDKKDEALHSERLDDLIAWGVSLCMTHVHNFYNITETNIDNGIADINICDHNFIAVHGDFDPASKTGVTNLSTKLGKLPYAILKGHLHTSAWNEIDAIKVIQGGSLAGTGDDHCIEKRIIGIPSQTILVCNNNGIDAHYPVTLV